ncbi:MAG: MoaD/ThiS family protein [Acidobacteriota bacterium]
MKIIVEYFAVVAEIAQTASECVMLADGATACDLLGEIHRRHPVLGRQGFVPLLAVNRRHADPDTKLADGDEVAVLPPLSGG